MTEPMASSSADSAVAAKKRSRKPQQAVSDSPQQPTIEEDTDVPPKKKVKRPKKTSQKKAIDGTLTAIGKSKSSILQAPAQLTDIGITLGKATGNTRRWLLYIKRTEGRSLQKQTFPTTPQYRAGRLHDLQPRSNREFVVDKIWSSSTTRKVRDVPIEGEERISVWHIDVYNAKLPDKQIVTLFPLLDRGLAEEPERDTHGKNLRFYEFCGGALANDICPTQEDARRVGLEACSILNRLPYDFEAVTWLQGTAAQETRCPGFRRYTEIMALFVLRPNFCHDQLFHTLRDKQEEVDQVHYRGVSLNRGNPLLVEMTENDGRKSIADRSKKLLRYKFWYTYFDIDTGEISSMRKSFMPLCIEFDGQIPGTPESFYFKAEPMGEKQNKYKEFSPEQHEELLRLVHHVQYEALFQVGTKQDVAEYVESIFVQYSNKDRGRSQIQRKIYGGSTITSVLKTDGGIEIQPSTAVRADFTSPVPGIALKRQSVLHVAVVINTIARSYVTTQSILQAWQDGVVVADTLNAGLLDDEGAMEVYCWCQDESARSSSVHPCQSCCTLLPCPTLLIDEEGGLRCRACVTILDYGLRFGTKYKQKKINYTFAAYLNRKVLLAVLRDTSRLVKDWTDDDRRARDDLERKLHTLANIHADTWNCSYTGKVYGWKLSPSGAEVMPARALSLEALSPAVKQKDPDTGELQGAARIHCDHNCQLVCVALNRMKSDWCVRIIPLSQIAFSRHEEGGVDFKDVNNALDHVLLIKMLLPRKVDKRQRAVAGLSDSEYRDFLKMWRSGRFNERAERRCRNRLAKLRWQCAGIWTHNQWSEAQRRTIIKIIGEIEARYNYYFPRRNGVPWLWNPEHDIPDYSWDVLQGIIQARFRTLDEICDPDEDHEDESTTTLLLEMVCQFAERRGGKDPFFGFDLTVFVGHPARFSIGRADDTKPGSRMQTGWTNKSPTSLSQHQKSHCTITVESWLTNTLKCNYHCGPGAMEDLRQLIRDILPSTEFWDDEDISRLPKVQDFMLDCLKTNRPIAPRAGTGSQRTMDQPVADEEEGDDSDDEDLDDRSGAVGAVRESPFEVAALFGDPGEASTTQATNQVETTTTVDAAAAFEEELDGLDEFARYQRILENTSKYLPAEERARYEQAVKFMVKQASK